MSGALIIPNAFATAVTATGAQLDADFNTCTAYINDPTNRNNYAADTGTTNTFSISTTPPVLGYTAGLWVTFKALTSNTGASTLNVNSLGAKNVFTPAGVALSGGEITVSQMVDAVYDGTQFQMVSPSAGAAGNPASAAQVSAAASLTTFIPPGRSQNQPGVAKAWAQWIGTNTGTITALSSYNVARIVRGGAGTYTVALTTPMASTAWAGAITAGGGSTGAQINNQNASTAVIITFNSTTPTDSTTVQFICFGNQ